MGGRLQGRIRGTRKRTGTWGEEWKRKMAKEMGIRGKGRGGKENEKR